MADNQLNIVTNDGNTVVAVNGTTTILEIITAGPQGPKGDGAEINADSFATTGSNTFIGTQRITGSVDITGSLTVNTINVGQNTINFIDDNRNIINSLSVQSGSTNIVINTGSLQSTGGAYFSGSFTGSLQGTASYYKEKDPIFTAKSASLATTGSNTFKSSQIISGTLDVYKPQEIATGGSNENPTSNNVYWSYAPLPSEINTINIKTGWIAQVVGGGTYTVTNVQPDVPYNPFIAITLDDPSLMLPYRCAINFSSPAKQWKFNSDGTTNIPGLIQLDGGAQITPSYYGYISGGIDIVAGPNGFAELVSNNSQSYVWVDNDGVFVLTSNSHQFEFRDDGYFVIPQVQSLTKQAGILSAGDIIIQADETQSWRFSSGSGVLHAPGAIEATSFTGSLEGTASYALTASYTPDLRPYKVYTALLTQTGGSSEISISGSALVKGTTYYTKESFIGDWDFSNVGGPVSPAMFQFVATADAAPNDWGPVELYYNTGAPVATVLENTIGNIWFQYDEVGQYFIQSNALFTSNKTIIFLGSFSADNREVPIGTYTIQSSDSNISFYTGQNGGNGLMNGYGIEIRVYN